MAVQFSVPDSPEKHTYQIEEFRGVDFSNASVNVESYRSPDSMNMIRDQVGKVRKRMGYETKTTLDGRINGFHKLGNQNLIHAGEKLYCYPLIGQAPDMNNMSIGATWKYQSAPLTPSQYNGLLGEGWSNWYYDETIVNDGQNAIQIDSSRFEYESSLISPPSHVKGTYRGFIIEINVEELAAEGNKIVMLNDKSGIPDEVATFNLAPVDSTTFTINGTTFSYNTWCTLVALSKDNKLNLFILQNDGTAKYTSVNNTIYVENRIYNKFMIEGIKKIKFRNVQISNGLNALDNTYYPDNRTNFEDYIEYISIYEQMNDHMSVGVPYGNKLYLLDGMTYLVFASGSVQPVSNNAYIPTIIIGRSPNGGGTPYESINLLQNKWIEQFLSDGVSTEYQLTTTDLDDTAVTCEKLQSDGTWKRITGFTVDRENGIVIFTSAIEGSPITGVDNVKITASKVRNGYAEKINLSTVCMLYGVGGAPDRLFVGGNPLQSNMDYYSEYNDLTYFGDTSYSVLGQEDSEIVGYRILNNRLATFFSQNSDGRNIIIRSGEFADDGTTAVFPVKNTIIGEGVIGKYTFCYLEKEPLYLSASGIYAVTTESYTSWKNMQIRSTFISPKLQNEPNLQNAYAFVYRDFYLLAINGKIYILDGKQKVYDRNAPFSSYQYECYLWDNVPARVLWEEGGALWFGMNDGTVCRFFNNVDDINSYNDNGAAINAYWETPDLDGSLFFKNKTFRYVAVRLASAVTTGIEIYVQKKGIWSKLFDGGAKARYFDWEHINFAKFSFSSDRTPRTIGGKIKIKKVDKAKFRLQNKELNEPFGLYAFALEYTEPGNNYKG